MFYRFDYQLISNPCCSQAVEGLTAEDFQYYDKDGFELNLAEQKYYEKSNLPLNNCLNHYCCQQPWFRSDRPTLILDHSLILHRAGYVGEAAEQLQSMKGHWPRAEFLLQTKQKWGFDFALDAVVNDTVFEVIHIEYDSYDYDHFVNRLIMFEQQVKHYDWHDAANRIYATKDQWQHLKGFEQNHWKANYLLGWQRAEYTEKAI
jgi:hypothetical protein